MRNLFPKAFLVTWIAVGALWAGTLHAQVTGLVRLISSRTCRRNCNKPSQTWDELSPDYPTIGLEIRGRLNEVLCLAKSASAVCH
jgi:hypothetical protein